MPYKDPLKHLESCRKTNKENRDLIQYARKLLDIPTDKRKKGKGAFA